jgi:hypothetical protein
LSDATEKTGNTDTVHHMFIGFKIAYDAVRREVLYSIFIEFGVPMKLARLIKMYLKEIYGKVHIGKYFSDSFPIQNGLKQGDELLFNFALGYANRKVQENHLGLKLDGTHQFLAYVDGMYLLEDNIEIIKGNTEALIDARK